MKGWITINTDAGFCHSERIGSYAYWIKGNGIFLSGSGVFKKKCASALDAEQKAIINAATVLLSTSCVGVVKIVFNRDNIYTGANGKHPLQKQLRAVLEQIKEKAKYNGNEELWEFRHVKAHQKANSRLNSRSWVNEWCDKQCTLELKRWRVIHHKTKKTSNA